jgi:hypothetical protein
VDLVIFSSADHVNDPDHVRIIAECKAPDENTGIGELKTYLSRKLGSASGLTVRSMPLSTSCSLASTSIITAEFPVLKILWGQPQNDHYCASLIFRNRLISVGFLFAFEIT